MTREFTDLFTVEEDGNWRTHICTCSDEGLIRAGRLKREVRRLLSEGSSELMPRQCKVSNFLTFAVTSLNWDFSARITSLANDQWSMVTAESFGREFKVFAECDEVEDGIAAAWYAFWLRKNEAD